MCREVPARVKEKSEKWAEKAYVEIYARYRPENVGRGPTRGVVSPVATNYRIGPGLNMFDLKASHTSQANPLPLRGFHESDVVTETKVIFFVCHLG